MRSPPQTWLAFELLDLSFGCCMSGYACSAARTRLLILHIPSAPMTAITVISQARVLIVDTV
jgi:hypothetical protein